MNERNVLTSLEDRHLKIYIITDHHSRVKIFRKRIIRVLFLLMLY